MGEVRAISQSGFHLAGECEVSVSDVIFFLSISGCFFLASRGTLALSTRKRPQIEKSTPNVTSPRMSLRLYVAFQDFV